MRSGEKVRINGLALCAGIGGMDLGIKLATRGQYRTVGYVEREAHAAATLVARMEDAALDRAPIWDDLSTFDGKRLRGCVDLVSSGLPCQPYSVAGSQKGHADERALWPEFVRIVRESEPALVFVENVPAFRKHFEPVWRELRSMGFQWAPPLLSTASESGAPHIRERFFALAAHPERIDLRVEPRRGGGAARPGPSEPGRDGKQAPDTNLERCSGQWCGWIFDGEREALRHDSDGCSDGCGIRGTLWDSESPPVRVDDGYPERVGELRAIGNIGTPPVVYARAFITLAGQLTPRCGSEERGWTNEK